MNPSQAFIWRRRYEDQSVFNISNPAAEVEQLRPVSV